MVLFPSDPAQGQKASGYLIEAAHTERQLFVVTLVAGVLLGHYLWPRRG